MIESEGKFPIADMSWSRIIGAVQAIEMKLWIKKEKPHELKKYKWEKKENNNITEILNENKENLTMQAI